MDPKKIARINELAKKKKEEDLKELIINFIYWLSCGKPDYIELTYYQ